MPHPALRHISAIALILITTAAVAQNYFGSTPQTAGDQPAANGAKTPLTPAAFKDHVKELDLKNKTYLRQLFNDEVAKMQAAGGSSKSSGATSTSASAPTGGTKGTTSTSTNPSQTTGTQGGSDYTGFGSGSGAGTGTSTGTTTTTPSSGGSGLGIQY